MSEQFCYRTAGVNIDAGNELVDRLKNIVKTTHRPGVLGNLGGFAGCFELGHYQQPVLVASTDGVGTKLRLAIETNRHQTIGIDLVAMCVNDLVVMGAEPLFFLDYYATGQLDVEQAQTVISGIAQGCQLANVALIGGETAEMPGMYAAKDYDLAGFTVGVVEKKAIIDGSQIAANDVLIALGSSGPHSNGYSLIRHLLQRKNLTLSDSQLEVLLKPTEIYVKAVLALAKANLLKGAAHITGGGLIDNIPRILPSHCAAFIDCQSWQLPPIFAWLQTQAALSSYELRRTFNCGIGMVLCVSPEKVALALEVLKAHPHPVWIMGQIMARQQQAVVFSDG